MTEFEEFAEALLDQISVETDEEKEIAELTSRINDDSTIPKSFENMEKFAENETSKLIQKVSDFTKLDVPSDIKIELVAEAKICEMIEPPVQQA